MIGAAVATIISYVVLYFITYFFANRFYKIPYENMKFLKMLVLAVVLFFLSTLTASFNTLPRDFNKSCFNNFISVYTISIQLL